MKKNSTTLIQKPSKTVGILAILFSLMFNNFILGRLFSPDYYIEFPNSSLIIFVQVIAFLWGMSLLFFAKKTSRVLAFLWGIGWALIILFFVEIISFIIYHLKSDHVIEIYDHNFITADSLLGFKNTPDVITKAIKIINQDTLYNVVYETDELGRRVVMHNYPHQEKFLAFFGCSNVFGHGLNTEQTIPFFVQKEAKNYKIYNYGVEGYGTHQVYTQIKTRELQDEIPEKEGLGIYIFIEDHLYRNIGSLHVYNTWGKTMPYYYLKNDQLFHHRNFTSGRKLRSFIYNLLGKSYLLKLFNFNWPPSLNKEDLDLAVKLIEMSSKKFKAHFPNSDFIVLIRPSMNSTVDFGNLLNKKGIITLDYHQLFDPKNQKFFMIGDEHPTAKANELIAKKLIDDLKDHYQFELIDFK